MRPLLLIGVFSFALSACGIKGPLELPPPYPVKTAPPANP
jgi:predicted small lipoprotein YifL